jgi:hypothetical protein
MIDCYNDRIINESEVKNLRNRLIKNVMKNPDSLRTKILHAISILKDEKLLYKIKNDLNIVD